ncbi:hypothetical protein TorRG33x02_287450, partial [Trema orientale]
DERERKNPDDEIVCASGSAWGSRSVDYGQKREPTFCQRCSHECPTPLCSLPI